MAVVPFVHAFSKSMDPIGSRSSTGVIVMITSDNL